MSELVRLTISDSTERDFEAVWNPDDGYAEIRIGTDVYADEILDDRDAAQAWVNAFDFQVLEESLDASENPPDFDEADYDRGGYLE